MYEVVFYLLKEGRKNEREGEMEGGREEMREGGKGKRRKEPCNEVSGPHGQATVVGPLHMTSKDVEEKEAESSVGMVVARGWRQRSGKVLVKGSKYEGA